VIAALMALAAIVDLAFCGFRATAGRSARIDKRRYYARAMAAGAGVGLVVVVVAFAAATLAMRATYPELVAIGTRMPVVIGAYAALVFAAIGLYLVAEHELRTLATVAILGPFTLMRPAVIAGAAAIGLAPGGARRRWR